MKGRRDVGNVILGNEDLNIRRDFFINFFLACLALSLASCSINPDKSFVKQDGKNPEDCNPYEIIVLRAERDFLRTLPELVQEASDKRALVQLLRLRGAKENHSSLRIEETPEGVRWGWLLLSLDMNAKAIRKVSNIDCSETADKFECALGLSDLVSKDNRVIERRPD